MGKADEVLRQIEKMSEHQFLPIIGPRKGRVLSDVIRQIKPKRVLEIGTLIGYSAILMGRELGYDAHVTTVEIQAEEAKMAEENIRKAEIPPTVDVLIGDAIEVIPKLKEIFDLVFIDAEKSDYLQYLRLVENKVHKGSVIVADNAAISAGPMRDYLNHVRFSGKYKSKFVRVGDDGLEISVRQ